MCRRRSPAIKAFIEDLCRSDIAFNRGPEHRIINLKDFRSIASSALFLDPLPINFLFPGVERSEVDTELSRDLCLSPLLAFDIEEVLDIVLKIGGLCCPLHLSDTIKLESGSYNRITAEATPGHGWLRLLLVHDEGARDI